MATLAERIAAVSGSEDDPKKPKPKGTPVVTVGKPVGVGIPQSEIDRLANAPDLKTRINARLALLNQPAGYVTEGTEHPVDQVAGAVGHMAKEIAVSVPRSAADAFLTPSVGEQRYNPALSKGGNSAGVTREQLAQPYDKEHGAVTGEERALAVAQTGANIIAPSMGAVPGGALVGAAYDPENPLRGAAFGAAAGAVLRAPALAERIADVSAGRARVPFSGPEVTPAEAIGVTPRRPLTAPSNAAQAVRTQVDAAAQFERGQVPLQQPERRPLARKPFDASVAAFQAAQDPLIVPQLQERAADLSNRLAPDLPPVQAGTRPQLASDPWMDAPLTVYHGTTAPEFNEFRVGHAPGWGDGIYFTDNEAQARQEFGHGGRVIKARVTLTNPYRDSGMPRNIEDTQAWKEIAHKWDYVGDAWQEDSKFVGKALRELGHDGIIADRSNGIEGKEVIAFHPHQVKQLREPTAPVDDLAARRNMAETGFATHGATPDAVILPANGAGRNGSTATAVANARAKIGPERLRAMADAELARRGGPVTPEAQMAAMEQVARNVASGDEIAAAGGERFSGLPVSKDLRERIGTATRSAIITPYAEIERAHPALANALLQGGAATKTAEHITERRLGWVHEGLTPEQRGQFGKRLVLDNMDTEAVRKQQAADDVMAEHRAASKDELRQKISDELTRRQRQVEMMPSAQRARYPKLQENADLADRFKKAKTSQQLEKMADDLFAQQHLDAAENWRAHAEKLRPDVTPGVENEPWFQSSLATYKKEIETPLQSAALAGGVDRASLREPALAYVKLSTTKALEDAEIRRALDVAGVTDVNDMQRRGPVARKLIGENPVLRDYFAQHADAPRQGPIQADVGPQGGVRGPRAQKVGSANRATGTGQEYSTDLSRVLTMDAADKMKKGRNNDVLRAVANAGRQLEPGEAPRPGYRTLAFDDKAGVVADNGVNRYEVTPEVHAAVTKYHAGSQAPSAAYRGLRKASDLATRAQISGMPVEATSHANTEVSIVGKVRGEKGIVNKVLALNPVPLPFAVKGDGKFMGGYSPILGNGSKMAAAREMNAIDFSHPDTRALESRLADIGALRIEQPHGGLINSAHHWLFGPEGVDARARIVLAQRYLKRVPNATDAALREFVNGMVGNYIPHNAASLPNFMAKGSILSPFSRFQTARIPTAIKTTFGELGLPAKNALQKTADVATTLYRGPIGLALGAAAGTYLLTGKKQSENAPGHALDINTGLYAVPGGIKHLSQQEADRLGDKAKPLYIPAGTIDPIAYAGMRATGVRSAFFAPEVPRSNAFSEAVRDVANVGLGMAGPGVRLAQTAVNGTVPYLQRDGTFLRTAPRRFNKNAEVGAQILKAGASANPALHALTATSGDAGLSLGAALAEDGKTFGGPASFAARAAEFVFPRFISPTIGGRTNEQSADAQTLRDYDATLTEYKHAAKRAPGPIAQAQIIADAMADAKSAGFDPMEVADKIQKAIDEDADVTKEKADRRVERRLDKVRP